MWKNYGDEIDWDNWSYDENDDWSAPKKEEEIIVKDSNWNILKDWDTVVSIKDIKVKWANDIKRWDSLQI